MFDYADNEIGLECQIESIYVEGGGVFRRRKDERKNEDKNKEGNTQRIEVLKRRCRAGKE